MTGKWPIQIRYARELRKNLTQEEKILWHYLRNRKLSGYKFLRQQPIMICGAGDIKQFYIADFYCAEKKLVLEVDGLIHTLQIDYDEARDIIMQEMKLTVLRVTNMEVNTNVFDVLKKIKMYL